MRDPKLVRMYRELDKDLAEFDDKLNGIGAYETRLFIPTLANRKMMQSELNALSARNMALVAPDEAYAIVKAQNSNFIEGLQQCLDYVYTRPGVRLGFGGFNLSSLFRKDSRPDLERKSILFSRLKQSEQQYAAMEEWMEELPATDINTFLASLESTREIIDIERADAKKHMPFLSTSELEELLDFMQSFSENTIPKWIRKFEETIKKKGGVVKSKQREDSDTVPIDKDAYRRALKGHGVCLDEILSWYEAEVEKTRSECFELANALDIPEKPVKTMSEVNDILFKYAGPADSPEEMFERAREYVTRGTAAAREYVWLPADAECPPSPMYKQMRASYPWGAGGSCCLHKRPFDGKFMLNDANFKAVTDGWIKINCIHEVHPGHYTQFLRMHLDPLPETFKRGAMHSCLTEGMCIRTEKLFEYIFAEDPYYPLFTAYRRHHTSVRIKVDLWLRYFGKTIGEIVDLYIEELGFDRQTARVQLQAHELMSGYFTTYYFGYKKVADWEKLYGFNKRDYTEILFSAGRVSMEVFERILKLTDEDRYSLQHEFASLRQFK